METSRERGGAALHQFNITADTVRTASQQRSGRRGVVRSGEMA